MSKIRDAGKAVQRGSADEALVLLWNELEPARLAGDRARLAGIRSLAGAIAARGDEAERREAERLLEAIERYERADGQETGVAATARVDGELSPVGEDAYETMEDEVGESRRRGGFGGLLWLVLLAGIVLFNLLGDLLGR